MTALQTLGQYYPGSRIGIMLVHGLTGTPTELSSLAKDLNKYGFSVLCPLLAGHCLSEEELIKTSRHDWAESVEKALVEFSRHMDVVFIGGFSAGAVLSLKMAQQYSRMLRGQVLYSTTLKWDGWSIPKVRFLFPLLIRLPYIGKRYRFMESYPYGLKNEKIRNKVSSLMLSGDASAAGFPGMPGFSLRELLKLVDEIKPRLPDVTVPTLLLHARHDDVASVKNAEYVKKNISGPSKLILLDDSYHMIPIDQEKKKVSRETAVYFYDLLTEHERQELNAHASSDAEDYELL